MQDLFGRPARVRYGGRDVGAAIARMAAVRLLDKEQLLDLCRATGRDSDSQGLRTRVHNLLRDAFIAVLAALDVTADHEEGVEQRDTRDGRMDILFALNGAQYLVDVSHTACAQSEWRAKVAQYEGARRDGMRAHFFPVVGVVTATTEYVLGMHALVTELALQLAEDGSPRERLHAALHAKLCELYRAAGRVLDCAWLALLDECAGVVQRDRDEVRAVLAEPARRSTGMQTEDEAQDGTPFFSCASQSFCASAAEDS